MFQLMLCFLLVYYGKYILIGYIGIVVILNILKRL